MISEETLCELKKSQVCCDVATDGPDYVDLVVEKFNEEEVWFKGMREPEGKFCIVRSKIVCISPKSYRWP